MFRLVFHPSSGAHNTVSTVSGINETCTATCYLSWTWMGGNEFPSSVSKEHDGFVFRANPRRIKRNPWSWRWTQYSPPKRYKLIADYRITPQTHNFFCHNCSFFSRRIFIGNMFLNSWLFVAKRHINPLNTELNPICHLLALLGTHHILRVSRIRVNEIWFWTCNWISQCVANLNSNKFWGFYWLLDCISRNERWLSVMNEIWNKICIGTYFLFVMVPKLWHFGK